MAAGYKFVSLLFYMVANLLTVVLLLPVTTLTLAWIIVRQLVMLPWTMRCCKSCNISKELFGVALAFQGYMVYDKCGTNIVAFLEFESRVPRRVCLELVREMLRFSIFNERIVCTPYGYAWAKPKRPFEDQEFIHEEELGQRSLHDYVSDFDPFFPLHGPQWRVHLLSSQHSDNSVMVFEFNHSLGDGKILLACLISLFNERKLDVKIGAAEAKGVPKPKRLTPSLFERVYCIAKTMFSYNTLLLTKADPPTPLKTVERGVTRHVKWAVTPPLPLEGLRNTARKMGGTITELMVATMSQAVIRLEEAKRSSLCVRGSVMRLDCIFDMRSQGKDLSTLADQALSGKSGVEIGHIFMRSSLDPHLTLQERVSWAREEMRTVYIGMGHLLSTQLILFASFVSSRFVYFLTTLLAYKLTCYFSNLAGPSTQLSYLGHNVKSLYNFVWPIAFGSGFSLLSYAGELRVVVSSDGVVSLEPTALVDVMMVILAEVADDQTKHADPTASDFKLQ
eukprot:gb/GEZN01006460.1/.p1 GENE.gb/GEZN01006460.1/~~gb/GEZN01006460.1/.p1  ORF type:complete len:506 (+),score=36.08 gb/GEZN01006460.1/:69-1586(+)